MEIFFLVLAIAAILFFIGCQIVNFRKTKKSIQSLKSVFPLDIEKFLHIQDFEIPTKTLKNKDELQSCLRHNNHFPSIKKSVDNVIVNNEDNPPIEYTEEYAQVSLITINEGMVISAPLKSIIISINSYLCKNIGTAADFSVITDICNHSIQIQENEIQNTLNVPLYFGLAGTFTGIICGLCGLDVSELSNSTTSLQHLFYGVIGAMSASLLGLLLTIHNSAIGYKEAISENDKNKELFFDFLRQELMPVLSNTMSQGLNSLRGVLGHFVDNFGRNLDAYVDSAELLNDNLEKQHQVLQELNKLSLTKTSMRIAETFKTLDESAKSFEVFKDYQDQLNSTISNLDKTSSKIEDIISTFNDFARELQKLSATQNATMQLQQDFKAAINQHFPLGSEGRDVWRKEFDELIEDARKASTQLSDELTNSTRYIANFVSNNSDFFGKISQLNEIIDLLVKYTQAQAEGYSQMTKEISSLRKDYKDAQQDTLELSKLTIEAIQEMTKQLKENKK